jgi:hypothetical protein
MQIYHNYKMKEKKFFSIIAGITTLATSIPIYNYYLLPVIRHKEMMDKIDSFDGRLKKMEKINK